MKSSEQVQEMLLLGTRLARYALSIDDKHVAAWEYLKINEQYINRRTRTSEVIGRINHLHSALSNRESEVIRLVNRGMTNGAIGEKMGITPGTVKIHIRNARMKTGVAK